jgi:hypothetical protein
MYDNQAEPAKDTAPIRLANDAELRQIGTGASASTASQSSNLQGVRSSSSAQTRRKEKVQVGNLIPDFTLLNQSGAPVSLSDFLGKKHIVLYFYPRIALPSVLKRPVPFGIAMKYSRTLEQK